VREVIQDVVVVHIVIDVAVEVEVMSVGDIEAEVEVEVRRDEEREAGVEVEVRKEDRPIQVLGIPISSAMACKLK
jgi:hypothetical protein